MDKVTVKNNSAVQIYRELDAKLISKEASHWLEFHYSSEPMKNPFTSMRVQSVFRILLFVRLRRS